MNVTFNIIFLSVAFYSLLQQFQRGCCWQLQALPIVRHYLPHIKLCLVFFLLVFLHMFSAPAKFLKKSNCAVFNVLHACKNFELVFFVSNILHVCFVVVWFLMLYMSAKTINLFVISNILHVCFVVVI